MPALTEIEKQAAKPLIYGMRSIIAWQQNAKTQTRRLPRPLPDRDDWKLWQDSEGRWWWYERQGRAGFRLIPVRQPYAVGDICWIREGLQRSYHLSDIAIVVYQADWKLAAPDGLVREWDWKRYKIPAIFMPRWACRYYARVLSVRPEPLHDISAQDAIAEGTLVGTGYSQPILVNFYHGTHHHLYWEWWDSMHRKPSTRSGDNPWVWVYGLEAADASPE